MWEERRKGNMKGVDDLVLDPANGISDDEFYNDGLHEMTPDEEERYYQQIKESQGFDVERIPNVFAHGIIQPAPIDPLYERRPRYFAQFAIDHHNKNKNEGGNLKLVGIIKCNWQDACPLNYYITFEAEDVATGHVDTHRLWWKAESKEKKLR